MARTVGRTPERAALSILAASAITEVCQRSWPNGCFLDGSIRTISSRMALGLGRFTSQRNTAGHQRRTPRTGQHPRPNS